MKTSADFGNDFHYIFSLFEETIRCQKAPHKMQCSSLRSISDVLTRNAHKVSRAFIIIKNLYNVKGARRENLTHTIYNSTNETDRTTSKNAYDSKNTYDKTTSKNYAGKSSYDKNCHNDAYDEDEME